MGQFELQVWAEACRCAATIGRQNSSTSTSDLLCPLYVDSSRPMSAKLQTFGTPFRSDQIGLSELVERFQSSNHMGCSKRPHSVDGRPTKRLSGFMESIV